MWIVTAAQAKELDRLAQSQFNISGSELMENAAEASFATITEITEPGAEIAIFCGKGNNGGDGLAIARIASKAGYIVHCTILADDRDSLSPLSKEQFQKLKMETNCETLFARNFDAEQFRKATTGAKLIVDSILGIGITGLLSPDIRDYVEAINSLNAPCLAIDQPTGIDTDTGQICGAAVEATRTITFGLPKPFLFLADGPVHSGEWSVAGIGFPEKLLKRPTSIRLSNLYECQSLIPTRPRTAHKGSNGHVLIVGGSARMPGAAVLCALAAYRSGAGLVTVASIPEVCNSVSMHLPEAILLPLPECEGEIAALGSELVLEKLQSVGAAVFGPGLGQSESVSTFLKTVWAGLSCPSVIDADALNAISRGTAPPTGDHILTPHPGELSRLLGTETRYIQGNRLECAAKLTELYNLTAVLKGAYSVISPPVGPICINPTGNPGMAVAGAGDVLCGVLATLLAQGLSVADAATLGVFWHGLAGDLCAMQISSTGFTSSEIANILPAARDRMKTS